MRCSPLLALTLLLASACVVSVDDPPAGGQYSCADAPDSCPSGMTCDSTTGLCRGDPTRGLGVPCTGPEDCDSSQCADGLCCATACPAQAAFECGRTGACLPTGADCVLWPRGTECGEPACAAGMLSVAASCDGTGLCVASEPAPCPGDYGCLDPQSCRAECGADADCRPGFFCHAEASGVPAVCRKRNLGESCLADGECLSEACAAGRCCGTRCADQGAASCGQTGACELSTPGAADYGSCALYPAGTECRPQSCTLATSTLISAASCPGAGEPCPSPQSALCPEGKSCANEDHCTGSCMVNTHQGCTDANAWCRQAADGTLSCQLNSQAPGEPCEVPADCAAGTCNNGLCCAQAPCCRSRADCPVDTHHCANVASCVNEDLTYACSAFACLESPDTVTDSCDGLLASSCNTFRDAVCPTPSCPASCRVNNQPDDSLCDAGHYCGTSTCLPKKDDQIACSTDHECKGGTCRLNYCCGATKPCAATDGTCSPVCTSPQTCQGYATAYDKGCCITTTTGNDSACRYSTNAKHAYACGGATGLFVECNGAAVQTPATKCANGCAQRQITPKIACVASTTTFCGSRCSCVGASLDQGCSDGVCSCGCAVLEHGMCKAIEGACLDGKTCTGALPATGCVGICK